MLSSSVPTTLDQIISVVRSRVELAKRALPLREMAQLANERKRPTRGFREKLLAAAKQNGFGIIAELKKASPSRGVLRGTFHVGGLAMQLERAGASALSVLTEEQFFSGSLDYLREASAASDLPCLRKDFIVDEYQLHEARANSADAILLIAAALSDAELQSLYSEARELGLDALCEVHNEAELERVAAIGADVVGVNSRDLRTLQVDMTTHARLAPHLPKNALRIAESGISNGVEIGELKKHGYQAFLVGELLMKSDDPGPVLAKLIADAKAAT
jgi:indole-3-glycerol phosphate synthase